MTTNDPPAVADPAAAKAATLAEALPWLARLHGRTVVVKVGGNALADPARQDSLAEDLVFLRYAGVRPVLVHGGGPQVTDALERAGLASEFVGGLRVTSPEALRVVRMVLVGQLGRDLVGRVNRHGPFAVGLSGEDGGFLTARRHRAQQEGAEVDLGLVGEVTAVDPTLLQTLLSDGRIPVVASLARGTGEDAGAALNVNADTAAAAIAVALAAEKLVVLTDVPGLYADWPATDEVISSLTAAEVERLLPRAAGGMAPKLAGCLAAVRGGVPRAHLVDGRVPHALLLELFTDRGTGTMVTAEP